VHRRSRVTASASLFHVTAGCSATRRRSAVVRDGSAGAVTALQARHAHVDGTGSSTEVGPFSRSTVFSILASIITGPSERLGKRPLSGLSDEELIRRLLDQ
jgi:hypothetical protein